MCIWIMCICTFARSKYTDTNINAKLEWVAQTHRSKSSHRVQPTYLCIYTYRYDYQCGAQKGPANSSHDFVANSSRRVQPPPPIQDLCACACVCVCVCVWVCVCVCVKEGRRGERERERERERENVNVRTNVCVWECTCIHIWIYTQTSTHKHRICMQVSCMYHMW